MIDPAIFYFIGLGVLFLLFLYVLLFYWLWNITMPLLFGLPTITFWQAVRLLILAGMLFGTSSFFHFNYNF